MKEERNKNRMCGGESAKRVKVEGISNEDVIEMFEEYTKNAAKKQEETLKTILERNAETEYLQKWNLNGRTDAKSFKECVPLATHADLEPYIQRIADGEPGPILTSERIELMSLSSGTTNGKQKFIPFNDNLLESTLDIYRISHAYRSRVFPIGGGRVLDILYGSKESKTKGGLVACTATTHVFRSQGYKLYRQNSQLLACSPDEVTFGYDSKQSLYCHLLCGLICASEVQLVSSTFAFSLVEAFRTFEEIWEQLCEDIREGKLNNKITLPSMKEAVSSLLKPNPELADSIFQKCKDAGDWYAIIPCLWPNAKYINSILTGSMEPYIKKLRHYAGNLPLVSAEYGASEGWIASNIDPTSPPENATYTVVPHIAYFEFIPLRPHLENANLDNNAASLEYSESVPVGLTEVKVGHEYEVVFTTFAGLYRYRLGDIVKVTGFHNSSPNLLYICRKQLILTVNIDKTTEKDLQIAVDKALELLKEEKVELVDFTSYADRSKDPGNYVIFWELSGSADEETLKKCSSVMEGSFVDPGYVGSRKANAIGALELCLVEKGTFKKIVEYYLTLGGAASQFKTPRCISSNEILRKILKENVTETYVSTHFS